MGESPKYLSRKIYKMRDKMVDWAQSRDERCVNRLYRATLHIYG